MFYLTHNNHNYLYKNLCKSNLIHQFGGNKINIDNNNNTNNHNINSTNNINNTNDNDDILELLSKKEWDKIVVKFNNPRDIKINGNNLLHLACARGETDAIEFYISKYPESFYMSNFDEDTCAHILVKYGHYELLKQLLPKFTETIFFMNKNDENLLDLTVEVPNIMNWIVDLIDSEYFNDNDQSKIFSLKSISKLIKMTNETDIYLEIINKLIDKGFRNIKYSIPFNPIIIASKLNKPVVVKKIIDAGLDINIRDINDLTALIIGVQHSSYDVVEELIKHKNLEINYAGTSGDEFPLNIAFMNRDIKMIDILINVPSINYEYKNKELEIPIHVALKNNINSDYLKPSVLYKLIYESDMNARDIYNITPMHLFAQYSQTNSLLNFLNILNNKYLDLSIKDNNNRTPLYYLSKTDRQILENSYKNNKTSLNYLSKTEQQILESPYKNTITNNKIKMPLLKTLNNKGLFNSDILHNVIYTKIMQNKYKNLGIPKQKYNIKKYNMEYDNFMYLSNYKSKEGKLMRNIIGIYYENFYELMPYLILWRSSDIYYYNEHLKQCVKKLMKDTKINFIMLKLSLIPFHNSTHANILIYNKYTNTLERFEPYGPIDVLDEESLNKFIERLGKEIFNKKIKFVYPKLYMNDARFQLVSSDDDPSNKKLGDPAGYCLAWCYWYLELRIKNKNIDAKTLVESAFNNIIRNKKKSSNHMLDYIRNYAYELDKMKNQFLKKCGIKPIDFYNIDYNDNVLDSIIDKLN